MCSIIVRTVGAVLGDEPPALVGTPVVTCRFGHGWFLLNRAHEAVQDKWQGAPLDLDSNCVVDLYGHVTEALALRKGDVVRVETTPTHETFQKVLDAPQIVGQLLFRGSFCRVISRIRGQLQFRSILARSS